MGGTEINKHGKYWVNGGDIFDNNRHRAYCLSASTKYFCVKSQEHILRVFPPGISDSTSITLYLLQKVSNFA